MGKPRAIAFTAREIAVIRAGIQILCSPWGSSGADEEAVSTAMAKIDGGQTSTAKKASRK